MADNSIQQPKGKISVALRRRQISMAFLIKIGLLSGIHRFFPTSITPKTRATFLSMLLE